MSYRPELQPHLWSPPLMESRVAPLPGILLSSNACLHGSCSSKPAGVCGLWLLLLLLLLLLTRMGRWGRRQKIFVYL